jgi:hypothetical protein
MKNITELHKETQKRHQEVLDMIKALSDVSSDGESSV